ncbi:MAG: flippase-like domain-containing protein [Labilithrix sp.]|nr:flippase-like domain-containing protein [Labilithrix sp.]
MTAQTRSRLFLAAKAVVAATLIGWLIRSGQLDFRALGLFFTDPRLLVADLAIVGIGVVCGALRWRALLSLAGVNMPVGRAVQLQMTALFFNVVIPGNVGGDVVKAVYASREATPQNRSAVFLIVFVERLLGLAGLVLVASSVAVLRGPVLWENPQLRQLAIAVAFLGACTIVGPALFVVFMRRAGDRLEKWTSGTSKIAKLAGQLVAAARLLSSGPKNLVIALGLSMIVHTVAMGFFTVLTRVITTQPVAFSAVATVFPLGILTLILPISPAGIGVGHVAFDKLFDIIGLDHGATVFNVYLIGQIAPCLLGVFPYLTLKRQGAIE